MLLPQLPWNLQGHNKSKTSLQNPEIGGLVATAAPGEVEPPLAYYNPLPMPIVRALQA